MCLLQFPCCCIDDSIFVSSTHHWSVRVINFLAKGEPKSTNIGVTLSISRNMHTCNMFAYRFVWLRSFRLLHLAFHFRQRHGVAVCTWVHATNTQYRNIHEIRMIKFDERRLKAICVLIRDQRDDISFTMCLASSNDWCLAEPLNGTFYCCNQKYSYSLIISSQLSLMLLKILPNRVCHTKNRCHLTRTQSHTPMCTARADYENRVINKHVPHNWETKQKKKTTTTTTGEWNSKECPPDKYETAKSVNASRCFIVIVYVSAFSI